jgi:hypothetical protein
MSEKKKIYKTSDLYFSAFLMGLDITLSEMEDGRNEKGHPKKLFVFILPENVDIKRIKAQFFGGSGTVKCRRFVDDLKNLKAMLHT